MPHVASYKQHGVVYRGTIIMWTAIRVSPKLGNKKRTILYTGGGGTFFFISKTKQEFFPFWIRTRYCDKIMLTTWSEYLAGPNPFESSDHCLTVDDEGRILMSLCLSRA